ncbi:MAG: nucleotidyltransferase [Candidatus Binatia bacterium]
MLSPDYRDILSAFIDEQVDYLVVGAYALASHGLPRATGDLDLWVRCDDENAKRVWRALAKFGAPLSEISESDFSDQGLVFQIGVEPSRIDILTSIDDVEFDEGYKDRLEIEVDGLRVHVIGREHLIANKKAVGRPQDLADVARLESLVKKG